MISQLEIIQLLEEGQNTKGGTISRLLILLSIEKQAKQVIGTKPVNSTTLH